MRVRVYVAGPISKGDLWKNVLRGVEAGMKLLAAGYAPMIPHLSCYISPEDVIGTARYEWWMENDFAWIEVADAMVRLDGESSGADREVALARSLGIPVFESAEAMIAAAPRTRREVRRPMHKTGKPSYPAMPGHPGKPPKPKKGK